MKKITVENLSDKELAMFKKALEKAGLNKKRIIIKDDAIIKSKKKIKTSSVDSISTISERSLAEDWNTKEDSRYDAIFDA